MKLCIEHYKNITLLQLSLMSYQTDWFKWLLICRRFCQGHSGHLCTNKLGKSKHSVNSTSQSILLHKGRMISTLKPHQRLPPANAGVTDFSGGPSQNHILSPASAHADTAKDDFTSRRYKSLLLVIIAPSSRPIIVACRHST